MTSKIDAGSSLMDGMRSAVAAVIALSALGWAGDALAEDPLDFGYLNSGIFYYDGNKAEQYLGEGGIEPFLRGVRSGEIKLSNPDGDAILLYNLTGPYWGVLKDALDAAAEHRATPVQLGYIAILKNGERIVHT